MTRVAVIACGLLALGCSAAKDVTRVGAKLVKEAVGPTAARPTVTVVSEPERWRLLSDEAHTGQNEAEYYFTLEADGKGVAPPTVVVRWPGVAVSRVLGADGPVSRAADEWRFRVHRGGPPTGVRTAIPSGRHINLLVFHNWLARRAGPYRTGEWPAVAIQAQLDYLFAAREAARLMGLADAAELGFTGDVRLYGFETNFPNGHVDHPPHFHIMLGWPGWLGTQATHFRLDAAGKILHNSLQIDTGKGLTAKEFAPGEVCECHDPQGRVGFTLTVLPDGSGVIWAWPHGGRRARLRREGAAGVSVALGSTGDTWQPAGVVRVTDQADLGRLSVTLTPPDGAPRTEQYRYDRDLGGLIRER